MTCCHGENLEYHYYSAVWITTLMVEIYFHVDLNMVLTNVDTTCGKKILPDNNYFVSNQRAPYHVYMFRGLLTCA